MSENEILDISQQEDAIFTYLKDDILNLVNASEGEDVQTAKPYGIGIDTACAFIDVTVFVIAADKCISYYHRFNTDWESLSNAKKWAVGIVETKSNPRVRILNDNGEVSDAFHYCIESTGNYHKAVLYSWGGMPSVVTPSIAGAAKKKTDKLDSKMLALHDMTGVWKPSFIPSLEIEGLRTLIAEREYASRMATRISNRINSTLLRFGYTVGRNGSVTKSSEVRELVQNIISDNPTTDGMNVCTIEIPIRVRALLRSMYEDYDRYNNLASQYDAEVLEKIRSMYWETEDDVLKGDQMLDILISAPGVSTKNACVWLAQIVTPRRFSSANAVSAYCGTDPSLKISADKVVSTKKRGGNVHLHYALCSSASILIKARSEPFGRWGANIFARTGKWKKATNAVGRKIAVALYNMQKSGKYFSYELYEMCRPVKVVDISISEFIDMTPGFKRYAKVLATMGIKSTQALVDEYNKCVFNDVKGLGKKFFVIVRDFIQNQKEFEKLYEEYSSKRKEKEKS